MSVTDGAAATWRARSVYRSVKLLLRSLRACSLGVVLVKVARCLHIYQATARLQQACFKIEIRRHEI